MTTPEQQNSEQALPPIIPPWVLLAVAGAGMLAALATFLLEGEPNVVVWGALVIGAISLVAWALMFPSEVLDILRGRSFSYGGTALLVIVGVIAAAMLVYAVVERQDWRTDLSERDIFSLDEEVETVLQAMGDDPSVPSVTFIGLYGAIDAAARDQIEVLFDDMVAAADGKIDYRFIDPNRDRGFVQNFLPQDDPNATLRTQQVIVAANNPETGEPDPNNSELVNPDQFALINAVLSLSATGDLRAYFLGVPGGIDIEDNSDIGASGFVAGLENNGWKVEQISPLQISGDDPAIDLNDPTANAEILVIGGGTQPLTVEALNAIMAYAANGGDLLVFGDISTEDTVPLALADEFASFLFDTYGVRLRNDLIVDEEQSLGSPLTAFANDYGTHPIVENFDDSQVIVADVTHSIEVATVPPEGVTVSVLVETSPTAYAKGDLDLTQQITPEMIAQDDDDLEGPFALAVAADNTNTGSRLVLFGAESLLYNLYRQFREVVSPELVLGAISWASEAENFADEIASIIPDPNPADAPTIVTNEQLSWMGFVALFVLPFGMLALGIAVWWVQRTNRRVPTTEKPVPTG